MKVQTNRIECGIYIIVHIKAGYLDGQLMKAHFNTKVSQGYVRSQT